MISQPDHNTTISIAESIEKSFEIGGYAHAGGGRKVTRVEISLDKGVTGNISTIDRKERLNEYGMHWCWVVWSFEIIGADLVGCDEIWCRAWDDANSPQPENPTWTLMGQNANHIFRMKVQTDQTATGEHVFRLEHPTPPGQQTGGLGHAASRQVFQRRLWTHLSVMCILRAWPGRMHVVVNFVDPF